MRRKYVCNASMSHARPCNVLRMHDGTVVTDECGCGCDLYGTCQEWEAMRREEESHITVSEARERLGLRGRRRRT